MIFKFLETIYPIVFLICGLGIAINIYGLDILMGSAQVLLIFSGLLAVVPNFLISGFKKGFSQKETWKIVFQSYHYSKDGIQNVAVALGILVLVGMLIPSWASSGILHSLTYLGILIIDPNFFLVAACIISAIISLTSGSSWSTAGTIGLALMSIGGVLGYPLPLVAGAILSGAYFGDKLSPLSDTTNLASAISKVPLSQHIRYMLPTTLLSFFISILIYLSLGFFLIPESNPSNRIIEYFMQENAGKLNLWKILIPLIVLIFVGFGFPAIPSLALGIVLAWILGYFDLNISLMELIKYSFQGYESNIGIELLDKLYSGGGILSMLPTIFLILSAMVFGGCMQGSGKITSLIHLLQRKIQKPHQLVLATMFFSYFINLTTSDQYLSIVIPGRTLRDLFKEADLDPKKLSRALEDSGTITSVLIPWNSCGAFMSTTLDVSVLSYLPFCFFHWTQIFLSFFLVILKIRKEEPIKKK